MDMVDPVMDPLSEVSIKDDVMDDVIDDEPVTAASATWFPTTVTADTSLPRFSSLQETEL